MDPRTSTSAEPRVRFLVLGPLEVWCGEDRLQLNQPLQRCVLGVLLLEAGRVVPLARLIEAAWGSQPPATARHQVVKLVSHLRKRLPDPETLIRDGAGYRIVIEDDQLDLTRFGARLARARQAAEGGAPAAAADELYAALKLWRGPVLEGSGGAVVESAAAVFEERRLTAAEQLVDLRLAAGQAVQAVGDLRALIAEHPLRESLRVQLMRALSHRGRPAEALEEYAQARHLLAETLGVDPGPELTRTYEEILRGAGPEHRPSGGGLAHAPQPVPARVTADLPVCALPYDVQDFTGREAETEALLAVADRPGPTMRLFTVDGMGGSGKTALAVHVAHALRATYPQAQLFVDLCAYNPGSAPLSPGEALGVLLRSLGVPGDHIPEETAARKTLWRTVTENIRLLLVLDNAVDARQVGPLLPVSADALVLVTSRTRMADLDGGASLAVTCMPRPDCQALLARCVGSRRIDAEPEAVDALIELCGRLPFALRIAASRLRARARWRVQDLVDRLSDEQHRLDELESGDHSVSANIALSVRALAPEHQLLLRQLGAHPGTDFGVGSVAALAGIARARADRSLDVLLDAHLLDQQSADRYSFHNLVRSFVHQLAAEEQFAPERERAVHRLMDDYVVTSRAATDILQPGRRDIPLDLPADAGAHRMPGDETQALAWFDAERANLVQCVHVARRTGLDRHAVLLARDLGNFLQQRGFLGDLLEVDTLAVEAARRVGDRSLERSALISLSAPCWHTGQHRRALHVLEQALAMAVADDDPADEALILSRMGSQLSNLGDFTAGLRHKMWALRLHDRLRDPRGACWALIGMSSALVRLGHYETAGGCATRALSLAGTLGDADAEIMARVNLANACNGRDGHDDALRHLEEALGVAGRTGAMDGLAVVHARLADTCALADDLDGAFIHGSQALELARAIRRPALTATAQNLLGAAHHRLGDAEAALSRYGSALEAAQEAESRYEQARALAGTGNAFRLQGRIEEAFARWDAALTSFAAMRVPEAAVVAETLATARRSGPPRAPEEHLARTPASHGGG
ncbi:BTAD domain-containing putative transcriptional regulator [Streptomyces sp. NPDC127039]|uniref:AfsR/SARP family transcriptional regulator n=1 Tax=Streptomyces sp. NPDC127039 TaxID=3347115 RepID=UPI003667D017